MFNIKISKIRFYMFFEINGKKKKLKGLQKNKNIKKVLKLGLSTFAFILICILLTLGNWLT